MLQEANQKIDTQLAEMARKNYGGGGGRGNFSRGFGTFKRGSMSNGGRPSNNRFSNYQSNNFGGGGGAAKTNGYSGGNSNGGSGGGGYGGGGNRNHTRFD